MHIHNFSHYLNLNFASIVDATTNIVEWCPTGIELEDRYSAIPPHERTIYQHVYLWYRRNFWYILAAGGTLLLAIILFDVLYDTHIDGNTHKNKPSKSNSAKNIQSGGDNVFSRKTSSALSAPGRAMSSTKAAMKAGVGSIKSGAAKKALSKGVGNAATKFKDASGTLYRWIFTIFIFFAVGVFIMPTFVMIILGILTFRIAQGSLRNTVNL